MSSAESEPNTLNITSDTPGPADRLFSALAGAADLIGVYLGEQLGLYGAMAGSTEPLTPAELARRAGIIDRYAREWLEQQTVAGYITCTDPSLSEDERTFTMPQESRALLADVDSVDYLAPLARALLLSARAAMELPPVYRGERTYGWEDHGPAMRQAQGDANRPAFLGLLASRWLPAIPDVHARLSDVARPARVAEVGCGEGWAAIALAEGYPHVMVDGFDIDVPSVTAARAHAASRGLGDRVQFHVEDMVDATVPGTYDLITAFECIHDMSDPVSVLRSARSMLSPGGVMVIGDEGAAERFDPDAGELERVFYGFSLSVCLPDGMSRQPSAGTGTVIRPETMKRYAREAGFAEVELLDAVPHEAWHFYRLAG